MGLCASTPAEKYQHELQKPPPEECGGTPSRNPPGRGQSLRFKEENLEKKSLAASGGRPKSNRGLAWSGGRTGGTSVNVDEVEDAAAFLALLSRFIHTLQAERGASTIYVASRGELLGELIASFADNTNSAFSELRESPVYQQSKSAVQQKDLDDLRAKIKLNRLGGRYSYVELEAGYREQIEKSIQCASEAVGQMANTRLGVSAAPALLFHYVKESVGHFRARVGGILAAGEIQLAEGMYVEFISMVDAIVDYAKAFMLLATPLQAEALEQARSQVPNAVTKMMSSIKRSQKDTETALANMRPEEWFQLMSKWMGNLEKVQRQLAQDLKIAAVKYLHEGSVSIKLLEQRTFKHNDHFTVSDAITQNLHDRLKHVLQKEWHIPLDQIQLEAEVGRGATGSTYRGKWDSTQVAVKVIRQESLASSADEKQSLLNEFGREVAALSKMRHPNVVSFLGASISPPKFCLIIEFCEGGNLWEVLRRQPETVDFLSMALQFASGMRYIHDTARMLHRDLKTPNLLLTKSGKLKIADFGMTLGDDEHNNQTAEVGTLRWMAPEMMLHQPYAAPADVYSMGIIFWELLTKDVPWRTLQIMGSLPPLAIVNALNAKKRLELPKDTPKPIAALIRECWHPDPEKRPPAADILRRLEAVAAACTDKQKAYLNSSHPGLGIEDFRL